MEIWCGSVFFFQAEDGIRDLVRSRGLGDVYKRQDLAWTPRRRESLLEERPGRRDHEHERSHVPREHLSLIHI